MNQEVKDILNQREKLFILGYAKAIGNTRKVCKEFSIHRSSFYDWKKAYDKEGEAGLLRKKPVAKSHPRKLKQSVIDKIVYLRNTYQLGSWRIKYYLERYHGSIISESIASRTLVKYKINRLPKTAYKRTLHTKRYCKDTAGYHVQIDVKFITLSNALGNKIKRYQFTAVDDATRIRAVKIYNKHNQKNAIEFIDDVVNKFLFRIHTIRTDRGHEFQAQFHWHVEDMGMRHIYIKPRSPQLNGKVGRSHRTDQEEFYQLLTYKDDVDLNKKMESWEQFYNFDRPHRAFEGKTPYETLRSLLI
ncbi:IS481 family transposase [Calditrichota bacterium]